jgi:hypothetical protein
MSTVNLWSGISADKHYTEGSWLQIRFDATVIKAIFNENGGVVDIPLTREWSVPTFDVNNAIMKVILKTLKMAKEKGFYGRVSADKDSVLHFQISAHLLSRQDDLIVLVE